MDAFERSRILMVDDRPENLLALEAILSTLNQTLVRATSGEEALKALEDEECAVILLDVQMPGMDGFETAAHIKRREKTKDVPIIFLTAIHSEPQDAFRGYAAGAVDYLTKPFDPWVLRAKVAVFVELHQKTRRLAEQAEMLREQVQPGASGKDGRGALHEISGRLSVVEEAAAALRLQMDKKPDSELADEVKALVAGVERLRSGLDALENPT